MIQEDSSTQDPTWPMVKFHFAVDLGPELPGVAFQEVSGLEMETQVIEYRDSNSPLFATIQMPGIPKFGNVTLKRGVFVNDNTFWNWMSAIKMNTISRRTVTIKLLDESGFVTMQWVLNNAWPTKITSTDLKSEGNEVAVESLEIAYETLVISEG